MRLRENSTEARSMQQRPELMGNDACGEAEGVADQVQVIAELTQDRYFACGSRQKPSISRQRVEEAEEAQPVHEIAAEGIDGYHALGLEFSEGDMNGPQARACRTQAVQRQVDAFADTHAGVAE